MKVKTIKTSSTSTVRKVFVLFFSVMVLAPSLADQVLLAGDTPLKTIQEFKAKIDENNLPALCFLMAESDSSGPLQRSHYEKMQQSLEGLVRLWQGLAFNYSEPVLNTSREPHSAKMTVRIERPRQEVRFTLLKFGTNWYISDIEIYFK